MANVSPELLGVAVAALSAFASFIGSYAATRVHIEYIKRDLAKVANSLEAAHWRLDEMGAPQAPRVSRPIL